MITLRRQGERSFETTFLGELVGAASKAVDLQLQHIDLLVSLDLLPHDDLLFHRLRYNLWHECPVKLADVVSVRDLQHLPVLHFHFTKEVRNRFLEGIIVFDGLLEILFEVGVVKIDLGVPGGIVVQIVGK